MRPPRGRCELPARPSISRRAILGPATISQCLWDAMGCVGHTPFGQRALAPLWRSSWRSSPPAPSRNRSRHQDRRWRRRSCPRSDAGADRRSQGRSSLANSGSKRVRHAERLGLDPHAAPESARRQGNEDVLLARVDAGLGVRSEEAEAQRAHEANAQPPVAVNRRPDGAGGSPRLPSRPGRRPRCAGQRRLKGGYESVRRRNA